MALLGGLDVDVMPLVGQLEIILRLRDRSSRPIALLDQNCDCPNRVVDVIRSCSVNEPDAIPRELLCGGC